MIALSNAPCERCKFFDKIKTTDAKKEEQYIMCKKAKNKHASELLKREKEKIVCRYFQEV